MKKFKLLFAVLGIVLSFSLANAQNIQVSGTVTDAATGEAISFASIQVKGTLAGGASDLNGKYSITTSANATLIFSFIGYKTEEIAVNGRSVVNVQLSSEAVSLEDVMVVAYGTAKKESFTGSAQTVTSDKIERRTVANVTKALEGMAPGVQSTSGSGQPGSGASIVIRGFGSLSASNTPLYVVDGIPYDGALNAINPNDIESITIIKDASAGALYGARGANGVIIVTTKKGKEGALTLDFKGSWGVASRAIPRYETMNSYEWVENSYQIYKNKLIKGGMSPHIAGEAALQEMLYGATKLFGNSQQYLPFNIDPDNLIDHSTGRIPAGTTLKWDEDWLDNATAPAPLRQEYQMIVSGGNNRSSHMFSLGYLNEEGLVKSTKFERFSGRANISSSVTDWLKAGLNTNFAANTTNSTALGSSQVGSSGYSNVFYSAMLMGPVYPLYQKDAAGNTIYDPETGKALYDWGADRPSGANAGWNPLANLEEDKYIGTTDNLSARTFIELGGLEEGVLQGVKLSANLGFDYAFSKSKTYWNPYFGNAASDKGLSAISDGRTFSYTFNQLLTWDRTICYHHNWSVLLGHEFYKYNYQNLYGEKSGFPFGGLYELSAATTITDADSYTDNYAIESYFSRVNYDYKDKYYLSGSFRRDGSSRFHRDHRWGNFWSVGASWRISQESFMQNLDWINNLTLKASYGVQGNDNIGSLYAWQSFYALGFPNQSLPGMVITSLESTELKWEKNKNFNTGIEARLFDRLSLSVEYYNRVTEDMLMAYPMALSTGFDSFNKNVGSMLNQGVEFTISGDVVKGRDFIWNSTLMGSTVSNRVLKLADKPQIISGSYIIKEGETMNSFYLAKSAGVDPATGKKLYWVWDLDPTGERGDEYISSSYTKAATCKEIVGSRIPTIYGSWLNEVKYKNFDLALSTTYSIGGKMYDGVYYSLLYHQYIGQTAHRDRLTKSWQKPGDVTPFPLVEYNGIMQITTTDKDLIDASYFAIKNITLGYTLPKRVSNKLKMKGLRLSLIADNLHIFTALKGTDPQFNFTGGNSFSYTPSRTISMGLDIKF